MKLIDVITAAVAAYKTNQGSIIGGDGRALVPDTDPPRYTYQWSNQTLMLHYLKKTFPETAAFDRTKKASGIPIIELTINDDIVREAERMMDVLSRFYLMALLGGKRVNKFTAEMAKFIETAGTASAQQLMGKTGMLSYFPSVATQCEISLRSEEKQLDFATSQYLGDIRDKLEIEVTIFNNIYSREWNRHFTKAYTSDNNVVFFSSDRPYEVNKQYRIRARIKKLDMNSQPGQPQYKITRLSHVKVLN